MTITQDGIRITKQFFTAIDILKANGTIRGLATFTKRHKINRWNIITVRDNPEHSYLKPEWIYFLSEDYNISLDWLFTGNGKFFKV